MTRISAIAAIGRETRAMGKDNQLLWRIPEDFWRLRALTEGRPIIMGSRTFVSIGRPLQGRSNIVLSRNPHVSAEGVIMARSLKEALERARELDKEELFIFGGAQVYTEALPYTERLYLTLVESDAEGDTFFPDYREFTKEMEREEGVHEGLRYTFLTLERE